MPVLTFTEFVSKTPIHVSKWGTSEVSDPLKWGIVVFAQLTAESPYSKQLAATQPSKLPLPMGVPGPHLTRVPWPNLSQNREQYHDRLSRFYRAHDRDRPTDGQIMLLRL